MTPASLRLVTLAACLCLTSLLAAAPKDLPNPDFTKGETIPEEDGVPASHRLRATHIS